MPANLGGRPRRDRGGQRRTLIADGRQPAPACAAAEHHGRHHEHGAVRGRVEGEAAERDRPAAWHADLVGDLGAVEQLAQPLLAGGEPVLARRNGDPGRLSPSGQPVAAPDPGHGPRMRQAGHQVTRIIDGDRPDNQMVGHPLG